MGWFTEVLDAIDKPSNALQGLFVEGTEGLKRGWNQEENYDFEQMWDEDLQKKGWSEREGFGETASYIGSTALNLVFDPLNVVGLGLFKKGAKAAGELKGAITSGNPNIITDYYGPMDKTLEAMASARQFGKEAGLSTKELDLMEAGEALIGNVKGKGEALGTGFMNAMKMQLPRNRALYRDTGINRPLFESSGRAQGSHTYKKNKKTGEIIPVDKEMVGRAIFNRWITKQKGKTGETKALDDIVARAVYVDEVGDVTRPLEKGFYGYANAKAIGPIGNNLTDKELLEVERSIMNTWKQKNALNVMMDIGKKGINKVADWVGLDDVKLQMSTGKGLEYSKGALVVVKKPSQKITGDHRRDFQSAIQLNKVAEEVFNVDKLPKSVDELYDSLSKVEWEETSKILRKKTKKKLVNLKKDDDGVWFTFSKPGSAVVEGGVNFRTKIKLDGDGFTVMSDEHNLAEALTGMSKLNRLITVSPPMHFNILRLKPKQTGLMSRAGYEKATPPAMKKYADFGFREVRVGGRKGPGGKGRLVNEARPDVKDFLMKQQPSAETLRKERMAMARRLVGGVVVTHDRGMFSE